MFGPKKKGQNSALRPKPGDTLISRFYTGTAHPSAVEFFPDGSAVAIDVKRGARTALKTP